MSLWKRSMCLFGIWITPLLGTFYLISLWQEIHSGNASNSASEVSTIMGQTVALPQAMERVRQAQMATLSWFMLIWLAATQLVQIGWIATALIGGTFSRRMREGFVRTVFCLVASSVPWLAQAVIQNDLVLLFIETMPPWFVLFTFTLIGGLAHFGLRQSIRFGSWLLREARLKDANIYRRTHPTFPLHKPN